MLDYNEEWNERALSFTTLQRLKVKAAAAKRTVILNVDQVGDHPARQENERGALFNLLSKS